MKNKMVWSGVLICVTVAVLAVRLPVAVAQRSSDYAAFDAVTDVYSMLRQHYYKDTSPDDLSLGMITGMIEALDDPYTEYIPNQDVAEFDKDVRGEFVGIGAQVQVQDGWLVIVTPLEDSPAYKAGLEADDRVVAVDGKSTWELPVDDTISMLTGVPGTTVTVTIERAGSDQDVPQGAKPATVPGALAIDEKRGEAPGPAAGTIRFDLSIVRERIQTRTVRGIHREGEEWSYMIDPQRKIGYLRLSQFTATTPGEVKQAVDQLLAQGMRGLIMDLRFNGGGALQAAIELADMFLPSGTIVSTRGRAAPEERATAVEPGTFPDFPLVVVLNETSASASEVLAGALADNGRAVVLGTRSFGKGVVQNVRRLPSGQGQLKVTESFYYLPSGRCLHRLDDSTEWGVDPTPGFYVPMTDDEYRRMFRLRREEEIIRPARAGNSTLAPDANASAPSQPADWSNPEWILQHLGDPQLSAAVSAIVQRLDAGQWKPTGSDAPPMAAVSEELKRDRETRELLIRELLRLDRRMTELSEASGVEPAEAPDLITATDDLTGGTIEVRDASGKVVATLKITASDIERWLTGAPLEPAGTENSSTTP